MTGRRRSLSLVIAAAAVGLLVAADLSVAQPTAGEARGGVLRVARFDDVDYVDPTLAYSGWSVPLLHPTCARLFNNPDRPDLCDPFGRRIPA